MTDLVVWDAPKLRPFAERANRRLLDRLHARRLDQRYDLRFVEKNHASVDLVTRDFPVVRPTENRPRTDAELLCDHLRLVERAQGRSRREDRLTWVCFRRVHAKDEMCVHLRSARDGIC